MNAPNPENPENCHASTFAKKSRNIQTFYGSIKWKDM